MAFDSGNKPLSRPILLLKDYLRDDDMGSCSSSGFQSFPRRQCCLHPRYSSSSCSDAKSALQKASQAMLNVIKSLQISAPQRSPSSSLSQTRRRKGKKGVLTRSFSRRLLSRNFWRRASSSKGDSNNKPRTFISTASYNSSNWVDTSFTCSLTAAEVSTDIEGSVTTTTATNSCSVTNSTREWPNEEKEQFSPVSVLDCLLFDDDEKITPPFNSTPCSRSLEEGAKHQHMQKSRDFNHIALLKPVIALFCDKVEEKALELVNHVKRTIPSNCLMRTTTEADNILCDFFKQSIGDINNNDDVDNLMKKHHLCKVAGDWIRGQHQEQHLSLESRELYIIKEMDKCRMWSNNFDDEEIECVVMELELEFFTRLVNELLVDLTA